MRKLRKKYCCIAGLIKYCLEGIINNYRKIISFNYFYKYYNVSAEKYKFQFFCNICRDCFFLLDKMFSEREGIIKNYTKLISFSGFY